MEGPTPVSALIHAATMVTAGVILLLRFSFILVYAHKLKLFIAILGMLTALTAAIAANFHSDIKSVIAYSTCSQLGYMVSVCGVSGYSLSLYHLLNHGFCKALLFLGAGIVIHNFYEAQDVVGFGGLAL